MLNYKLTADVSAMLNHFAIVLNCFKRRIKENFLVFYGALRQVEISKVKSVHQKCVHSVSRAIVLSARV